jgi:hypothetical protein
LILERFYFDSDGNEFELSSDTLAHHTECVVHQLANLGVAAALPTAGDVLVDASYEQIRATLNTTAVDSMEVSCTELSCPECHFLSEAECRADAVCVPVMAARLDAARNCKANEYAGCLPPMVCGASLTTALDPPGACWLFSDTCMPEGFAGTLSTDPVCGYAPFDRVGSCASP